MTLLIPNSTPFLLRRIHDPTQEKVGLLSYSYTYKNRKQLHYSCLGKQVQV